MSWRGRSTYRRRPRRYVEPPEMIGPMLPEQFSDEEVEPPKPEEGEPATQSQDPAPAQEGEDEGASAGQGDGKGRRMPAGVCVCVCTCACVHVCVCYALSHRRNGGKKSMERMPEIDWKSRRLCSLQLSLGKSLTMIKFLDFMNERIEVLGL
uniref:GAGE domain-containing protein n=2 Tax=Macaca TaxID=9539 RepID=A0A7N9ICH5_MACFA